MLPFPCFGPMPSVLQAARAISLISYLEFPVGPRDDRCGGEANSNSSLLLENTTGRAEPRGDRENLPRGHRIRAAGAYFWKACADDEPGLLPAPGGWLAKVRIFFPLPVHAGLDELPCID